MSDETMPAAPIQNEAPPPAPIETEAPEAEEPVDLNADPAVDPEPEPEGQPEEGEEGEADPEAETPDEDDELEEVEFEGRRTRVPKWLKPGLMKDADYRRKTTEVAEQRRAFEAEKQQFEERVKAEEEFAADFSNLNKAREALEYYNRLNWDELEAEDPLKAQSEWRKYEQWHRYHDATAQQIQQKQTERQQAAQQDYAKRAAEAHKVVLRDIPGWDAERGKALVNYARDNGLSDAHITEIGADAALIKLLNKASMYDQIAAKKPKNPQPQSMKPLAKVAGKSSPGARRPLADIDDMDEYVKARKSGRKA